MIAPVGGPGEGESEQVEQQNKYFDGLGRGDDQSLILRDLIFRSFSPSYNLACIPQLGI